MPTGTPKHFCPCTPCSPPHACMRVHNARRLSALTIASIFTAYVVLVWRATGITTQARAFAVGAYWFVATMATEAIVLNRWMGGMSWRAILTTYNVLAGELWPLVLIYVGVLPALVHAIKGG